MTRLILYLNNPEMHRTGLVLIFTVVTHPEMDQLWTFTILTCSAWAGPNLDIQGPDASFRHSGSRQAQEHFFVLTRPGDVQFEIFRFLTYSGQS